MVEQAFDPSTQEVEESGSLCVQGQSDLYSEALSQKRKNDKKDLFYVYMCLACIYTSAAHKCLVTEKARRGDQIPRNSSF